MNRSLGLIVALIGIGAIGAGMYFFSGSDVNAPSETGEVAGIKTEQDVDTSDALEEDTDAVQYRISEESEVRYVAMKEWLQKPVEEVVGINGNVTGDMTLTESEDAFMLEATIDSQTFESGSGGRDREVRNLFTEDIVIATNEPIVHTSGTYEGDVLLDVTINGVTQTVPFTVTADMNDDEVKAQGEGTLIISDFGIKAPSALNLYSVADELGLAFDIMAQKQ